MSIDPLLLFCIVVYVFTGFVAYCDASTHKIGKLPDRKGVTNMSAAAWGAFALLLPYIGYFVYMARRKKLLALAKEHPVKAPFMGRNASIFALIGAAVIAAIVVPHWLAVRGQVPGCNSESASSTISDNFNNTAAISGYNVSFERLDNVHEVNYNQSVDSRLCTATLETTQGPDDVVYKIQWYDKSQRQIDVIIQDAAAYRKDSGSD